MGRERFLYVRCCASRSASVFPFRLGVLEREGARELIPIRQAIAEWAPIFNIPSVFPASLRRPTRPLAVEFAPRKPFGTISDYSQG